MKVMITGINGQVGWEIARQAEAGGIFPILLDRHRLDITDPRATERLVKKGKPGLLINAAAYTQVDRAETEAALAEKVNRDAPGHLAACCAAAGIPMIHISTDYVFNGTHTQPYRESSPCSPMGVYGRSKAAGEERIRTQLAHHLIVRTSWVYGVHGGNFVKTMLRIGGERDRIGVVSDQQGCPTAAGDLAAALLEMARQISRGGLVTWGTYHYCGHGVTTWFEFAKEIFRIAHRLGYTHHPAVNPITTAEYPTPARRPAYSALDCTQLSRIFGIQPPSWRQSLSGVIKELLSQP